MDSASRKSGQKFTVVIHFVDNNMNDIEIDLKEPTSSFDIKNLLETMTRIPKSNIELMFKGYEVSDYLIIDKNSLYKKFDCKIKTANETKTTINIANNYNEFESSITFLQNLGKSRDQVIQALKTTNGDVDKAITLLTAKSIPLSHANDYSSDSDDEPTLIAPLTSNSDISRQTYNDIHVISYSSSDHETSSDSCPIMLSDAASNVNSDANKDTLKPKQPISREEKIKLINNDEIHSPNLLERVLDERRSKPHVSYEEPPSDSFSGEESLKTVYKPGQLNTQQPNSQTNAQNNVEHDIFQNYDPNNKTQTSKSKHSHRAQVVARDHPDLEQDDKKFLASVDNPYLPVSNNYFVILGFEGSSNINLVTDVKEKTEDQASRKITEFLGDKRIITLPEYDLINMYRENKLIIHPSLQEYAQTLPMHPKKLILMDRRAYTSKALSQMIRDCNLPYNAIFHEITKKFPRISMNEFRCLAKYRRNTNLLHVIPTNKPATNSTKTRSNSKSRSNDEDEYTPYQKSTNISSEPTKHQKSSNCERIIGEIIKITKIQSLSKKEKSITMQCFNGMPKDERKNALALINLKSPNLRINRNSVFVDVGQYPHMTRKEYDLLQRMRMSKLNVPEKYKKFINEPKDKDMDITIFDRRKYKDKVEREQIYKETDKMTFNEFAVLYMIRFDENKLAQPVFYKYHRTKPPQKRGPRVQKPENTPKEEEKDEDGGYTQHISSNIPSLTIRTRSQESESESDEEESVYEFEADDEEESESTHVSDHSTQSTHSTESSHTQNSDQDENVEVTDNTNKENNKEIQDIREMINRLRELVISDEVAKDLLKRTNYNPGWAAVQFYKDVYDVPHK